MFVNKTMFARRSPQSLAEAWIALTGLSAVFLFEMLDNSILNVALPTIGRELGASTLELQWVTGAYGVVFGGLMLVFGALADRIGRRRVMLIGLVLLALAGLSTLLVTTATQLIVVRAVMGVAAAMTTPGSMALAFRLFETESLRIRAITLISTVGLVGLAIGPVVGGFALAVAPWQALLVVNVPVAALAFVGLRIGIAPDDAAELHRERADVLGGVLGTATIVLALLAPTVFVAQGASWLAWGTSGAAVLGAVLFVRRERAVAHPLLDLALVARPLVASGLLYKAATGLASGGMGFLVTLQLQLAWGWPPALAAAGLLPQVIVLIASGPFIDPFVRRVGIGPASWLGAAAVVVGLAVYASLSSFGYAWVALALVLVAAGLRVVGVVAGVNVLSGLPDNRTSIGAALIDTLTEVSAAIGLAVAGTMLAAVFAGDITSVPWSGLQSLQFRQAVGIGGWVLTAAAAALVAWGRWLVRTGARPAIT